jgi:hypothetical protein
MTATTTTLYAVAVQNAFAGEVNWTSDAVHLALVLATYTPNLVTDSVWTAISSHEASGSGYTTGGVLLSGVVAGVLGYSGVSPWLANTTYAADQVMNASSLMFICVAGGMSGVTAPTWPTSQGVTVPDNTATWACLGSYVSYFTSGTASWNPLSVTNVRYGVIYDATNESLIALIDMGSGQTLTGPFGLQPDPVTGWFFFSG